MANTAVVYDRNVGDRELNFEPSGGLLDASLVMRDRETNSWWSIMTSNAIGGDLTGSDLTEIPAGEKATWKGWSKKHPDTLVLSIDGREHVENNPYDNYFSNDRTFRGMTIDDDRLPPKALIYSFWLGDKPYAVAHDSFEGGAVFSLREMPNFNIVLYRPAGASFYLSTRAYRVGVEDAPQPEDVEAFIAAAEAKGTTYAEPLSGFDTYWYNWIAVNEDSRLLE